VIFSAIALCVASQRVFIVVYFVIDSVRNLLDTPSFIVRLSEEPDYELRTCILNRIKPLTQGAERNEHIERKNTLACYKYILASNKARYIVTEERRMFRLNAIFS
jgi:hypothetical protein